MAQGQSTPDRHPTVHPTSDSNIATNRENDIFVIEDQESPDQFLRRLAQSNKRKRIGSPEIEDVATKQESMTITKARLVLDIFIVLSNLCEKLANNIDRNTKKEIKDISVRLSRKTAKLTKIELWDWLEQIVDSSIETWKNPTKEHTERATQTEPLDNSNKDSRDQGTQCTLTDDQPAFPDKTPDNAEELKALLDRNMVQPHDTSNRKSVNAQRQTRHRFNADRQRTADGHRNLQNHRRPRARITRNRYDEIKPGMRQPFDSISK